VGEARPSLIADLRSRFFAVKPPRRNVNGWPSTVAALEVSERGVEDWLAVMVLSVRVGGERVAQRGGVRLGGRSPRSPPFLAPRPLWQSGR